MNIIINNELKKMGYYELDDELQQMTLIQQLFASHFTFENIDVLHKNNQRIDELFLIDKILVQRRGGLCYELNGTLFLVLKALGFDVILGSATVWSSDGWVIDRTHTIIMYYKNNDMYLLDSGSGTNLSIKPLQLDGEPVQSAVGLFRLRTEKTTRGTIVSEKLTEEGWTLRYAFNPIPVDFIDDLNRIKQMIHNDPSSPFNKDVLVAMTLADGTVSINEERLSRKWVNKEGLEGREERIQFENNNDILQAIKQHGSKSTYQAAKHYFQ